MFLKERLYQAAMAKRINLDVFSYTATWLTFGAAAITPFTVAISADADFAWFGLTGAVYTAANVLDPAPDITVMFTDTGSGRNLQDFPIHWNNIVGTAQFPFYFPEGKLLIGNGGMTITLANISGIAKGRIDLMLIGQKVFYLKSYNRDQLLA